MYTFNQNCISSHAASCTNKPSEILESEEIILFNNHDSIYKNGEFIDKESAKFVLFLTTVAQQHIYHQRLKGHT